MNIKQLIELGAKHGRVIKPSHVDAAMCCLDCGEATDPNERGRMTADGAFLTVVDGRYWQVGPIKDVAAWLNSMEQ